MARTAPFPNIPAIPGMNPGVFVMGGGGGAGGGRGRIRGEDRLSDAQIDEVNARIKKKFQEEKLSIETFAREADTKKGKNRVDHCQKCGQMLENLGITDCVVGETGKRGKYKTFKP